MNGTPLEIIKTLLQYGKVIIHPLGEESDRYVVELQLKSGEIVKAYDSSVEQTIKKLLTVLDEHIRKT